MFNRSLTSRTSKQKGASLVEVLIAILILSFGMLSLGVMLSISLNLPKLSAYRSTAVNLASAHIERIRANPDGFRGNFYTSPLSFDGTSASLPANECTYPFCTVTTLARMDTAAANKAIRAALPAGGMLLQCDPGPCSAVSNSTGDLWVVWQEPASNASINPASSDVCPAEITGVFTNSMPRCLYVRFKL